MRALVTAGGTSEPIDDVRSVTNFSTGRFPVAIAAALASRSVDVEVLGSSEAVHHAEAAGLAHTRFRSSANLDAHLDERAAGSEPPQVVLHLAAVSDYVPVPASGKLSSDADELTVTMRRNAKLIDSFRGRFPAHTFIVAAKLTSGATPAETIDAGRSLLKRTQVSLVIANDLSECRDGMHPCWLLTQEGGALRVEGTRADVAERIAEFIVRRFEVTWAVTRFANGEYGDPPVPDLGEPAAGLFADMLDFAADASLLPGLDGNAVVRATEVFPSRTSVPLYVTPRQVPKAELEVADGLLALSEPNDCRTWVWANDRRPDAKPSIDTSVQARILMAFSNLEGILHTHECFGAAQVMTRFPYPCGAAEEAVEVLAAAAEAGVDPASDVLTVELAHHGFLLGVTAGSLAAMRSGFAVQLAEYRDHLADVGASDVELDAAVPVFAADVVVGVVGHVAGGVSVHLGEAARGRGLGAVLASQLIRRRLDVVTVDACEVVDYWSSHGFDPVRRDDGLVVLAAPAQPDDLPV